MTSEKDTPKGQAGSVRPEAGAGVSQPWRRPRRVYLSREPAPREQTRNQTRSRSLVTGKSQQHEATPTGRERRGQTGPVVSSSVGKKEMLATFLNLCC